MEGETMDIETELVCVMVSLGYNDDDDYFKGEDCLPSLKDLIKFLRHEDESCNIRRQMGKSQLLQKDLLPLFIYHGDDKELTDMVIRLLVNLTTPADICFNQHQREAEEVGKMNFTNTHQTKYLEVVNCLQNYKEAFTTEKSLAAVAAQLGRILQMEWEDRGEDEFLLFERLLLLLRNILHVPSNPDEEKRADGDATLHDQILWNIHVNGIDDLLIYICSSPEESRWSMHAIEIISLLLREQNPEKLAQTSKERSDTEKNEDTKALLLVKEREEAMKKNSSKALKTTRHSRFGGSFWVKNLKGVGMKNTLVHHKHISKPEDISFDNKKYKARKPIKKQEAKNAMNERSSSLSIRLLLKEFSIKFLENCYNPLMRTVKDNIARKRSQENDETYYLWALRFFMAFNRINSFKVEFVSETLNMNSFYYILKQINHYYEHFFMHKRGGWEPWQKRLHFAIKAYKELLTYITNMDGSSDSVLKDASSVMKNNVFYHEEYRGIFLVLIRHYDAHKQPRDYLSDLVDTFHIFLKMLEKFCGNQGSVLIKTKRKKTKRRALKRPQQQQTRQFTSNELEDMWENDIAPGLSSILQGNDEIPENVESPFDATSDAPEDEQRNVAMVKIQDYLRDGKHGEGVALLRASRECWPDENMLGGQNLSPEDEFMVIRALLFQEIERPAFMQTEPEEMEEEYNEELEEEEEEEQVESIEKEFSIQHFLSSLASPHILMPYNHLLKSFKTNSTFTNHAIIKMFHRVAVDLKFTEMLFQLSLFLTFKEILDIECSQFKEMAKFAKYIINKFVALAKEKPNIFVEMLFWKGTGDCYQISEREVIRETSSKQTREKWTYEDEEELKSLYDQYKESDDIVGDILKGIQDQDRTRRQITNKLVRLRIVENAKELPKPRKAKARDWSEEQTEELHRLYEEFKETEDPIGNILIGSTSGKSKNNIIKQLIDTGKIADRSEVMKKKPPKMTKDKKQSFKDQVNNQSSSDESDNEEGNFERFLQSQRTQQDEGESGNESDDDTNKTHESETDDLPLNATLSQMVQAVKEKGFSSQLVWLETKLTREMEGREEDEGESFATPLLTMTDNDERAIQNKTFRCILKKLGLHPPEDFSVAPWWTIPAKLTPVDLKKLIEKLKESGQPQESAMKHAEESPSAMETSSSSSSRKKPVKKLKSFLMEDSDADSDDEPLVMAQNENSNRESNEMEEGSQSYSDSEISNARTKKDRNKESIHRTEKTKKASSRLKNSSFVDSDSENENLGEQKTKKQKNTNPSKVQSSPLLESDSGDGKTKRARKRSKVRKPFLNSESESEDDEGKKKQSNYTQEENARTSIDKENIQPLPNSHSQTNGSEEVVTEKTKGIKRRSAMLDSDNEEDTLDTMKKNESKRSRVEDTEVLQESQTLNTVDSNVTDSLFQKKTLNGFASDEEATESLQDQSALNFSLRLSDDEMDPVDR